MNNCIYDKMYNFFDKQIDASLPLPLATPLKYALSAPKTLY